MAYSWTTSSAITYDLTSVSTNDRAAPIATAREGGFTMRNRIEWETGVTPTMTDGVMNVLKILRVPKRTVVEDVYLVCPAGGTATTHTVGISYAVSASTASATAGIGFIAYDSKNWNSASTVTAGFGKATVDNSKLHTGSVVALPTIATTPKTSIRAIKTGIAGANHGWADGAGDGQIGVAFPHGGYITFQILAGKGSGSGLASWDAEFAGTTEVVARGWKLPE